MFSSLSIRDRQLLRQQLDAAIVASWSLVELRDRLAESIAADLAARTTEISRSAVPARQENPVCPECGRAMRFCTISMAWACRCGYSTMERGGR